VLDVEVIVVCRIHIRLVDLRRRLASQNQVRWIAVPVEVVGGTARSQVNYKWNSCSILVILWIQIEGEASDSD
jgi:hypothetical protein